jgi:hypothetical protein
VQLLRLGALFACPAFGPEELAKTIDVNSNIKIEFFIVFPLNMVI